ncbi:MAG: hypothetical protein ACTSWX_01935 [Promethearchaeota archaeon]
MSLWLFFKDELKGFYLSKIMLVLWIGMPLISISMHFFQPNAEDIPITILVGILIASLGGVLSSVMLSTTIVSEKNRHVYDLYLIRPIKRFNIMFAKFLAVYSCLGISTLISLGFGIIIDSFNSEIALKLILDDTIDALSVSFAAMAIACTAGILIGLLSNSVMIAAILSVYIANQLSMLAVLPGVMFEKIDTVTFSLIVGSAISIITLFVIAKIIEKKEF